MIQQAETLIEYGYLPMDLKLQSNKPIKAACDNCSKVRVFPKHRYHHLCLSCAMKAVSKGNTNGLGYKHTKEVRAKMSAARKGNTYALGSTHTNVSGEKAPNGQGGISFEPYCQKFNEAFKEYIRAKFCYTCFLCPLTQEENGQKLSVHHVNYNKNCGCDGDKTCQFVPLCKSCHSKTNNNRDYWQKIITEKLHNTIICWAV